MASMSDTEEIKALMAAQLVLPERIRSAPTPHTTDLGDLIRRARACLRPDPGGHIAPLREDMQPCALLLTSTAYVASEGGG